MRKSPNDRQSLLGKLKVDGDGVGHTDTDTDTDTDFDTGTDFDFDTGTDFDFDTGTDFDFDTDTDTDIDFDTGTDLDLAGGVYLFTHEFRPKVGGIGTYVEELARAGVAAGARVTVFAPQGSGATGDETLPFAVHRIAMRGKQDWFCQRRMARAVKQHFGVARRVNATFVLAEPGPIRTWLRADQWRLPMAERLVVLLHGSELAALRSDKRFVQLLERAERIGVVSQAVLGMLGEVGEHLAAKAVRVPGAVRHQWLALGRAPRSGRSAAENPRKFTILQVGRIHPRKGQLVFLEAVRLMLGALPPGVHADALRIQIFGPVGSKTYARRLRTLAASLPVAVDIRHDVADVELVAAYRQAYCVVFPSCPHRNSIEGLGLGILDAGYFGCPVIASAIGGTGDALIADETGKMVPPCNAAALAHTILQMLAQPELAAEMGRAAGEFVRRHFSWQQNWRRLCE